MHLKTSKAILPLLLVLASLGFATPTIEVTFGPWNRASNERILSPRGTTWESAGTFHPATVAHDGKICMRYRAQDSSVTPRLGYAESVAGIHFTR
jgi:hypothetical protein